MKKVVVTGGSGRLGQFVIPRIARARLSGVEFGSGFAAGKNMPDLGRGLASLG